MDHPSHDQLPDNRDPRTAGDLARSPLTRRRLLQAGAGLTALTVFPGILAACGGDSGTSGATTSGTTTAAAPDIGGTIRFLGWEGEEAKAVTGAWRKQNDVTIEATPMSGQADILNALTIGTPLDLVNPFNGFIPVLDSSSLLQPFDRSLIPNFEDLFPVLKQAEWLYNASGDVMAVPIIWGDGPFVYSPDNIPTSPPKTITDLGNPEWKDSLVWLDDPYTTIQGFASTLGFANPTELTREQLDEVVEAAEPVMDNVVSIAASFGDATDFLVRGEASISPIGWRVMVQEGAKRGTELIAENMKNFGVAFCDCYSVPADADNATTAQAYANEVISPKVNAELAASLQSGAVTEPAYEELDKENQELYDYDLVTDPNFPAKIVNSLPPEEPEDGIMGSEDWQQAWNELKSA